MNPLRRRSVLLLPLIFLGAWTALVQPQSQRWQADIRIPTPEVTKMKSNMAVKIIHLHVRGVKTW